MSKTQSQPILQIKSVGVIGKHSMGNVRPPFAASKKSDEGHCRECLNLRKIKPENMIWFNTAQEARNSGYSPFSVCDPAGCNRLPSAGKPSQKLLQLRLFKLNRAALPSF